jgi:hypothetical protein
MITSPLIGATAIEKRVRDHARLLGLGDEGAVLLALDRCAQYVLRGGDPKSAAHEACGLLASWARHPSNQRRNADAASL